MRTALLATLPVIVLISWHSPSACGEPVDVEWITQYCNETLDTVDLPGPTRMLRNITNSDMTAAPSYLDGATFLRRRTNMEDRCPELEGIGEDSQDWLHPNRVSLSAPAVVLAAVRENYYPGAGALLASLGWTPLGDTITMDYFAGAANLPLYAGLVGPGPVHITGAGLVDFRDGADNVLASHYIFFQDQDAFPAGTLAQLRAVPEPSSLALVGMGAVVLLGARRWLRQVRRDSPHVASSIAEQGEPCHPRTDRRSAVISPPHAVAGGRRPCRRVGHRRWRACRRPTHNARRSNRQTVR